MSHTPNDNHPSPQVIQNKKNWRKLKHTLFLLLTLLAWLWIGMMPINHYEWMLADPHVETLPYDPDTGLYANLTLIAVILVILMTYLGFKARQRYALLLLCVLPLGLYWGLKFGPSFIQQYHLHPDETASIKSQSSAAAKMA